MDCQWRPCKTSGNYEVAGHAITELQSRKATSGTSWGDWVYQATPRTLRFFPDGTLYAGLQMFRKLSRLKIPRGLSHYSKCKENYKWMQQRPISMWHPRTKLCYLTLYMKGIYCNIPQFLQISGISLLQMLHHVL